MLLFLGSGPEGQSTHVLKGDSGGPCFSQRKDGRWLVGIASIGSEESNGSLRASYFTSTFVHRAWIRQQQEKSKAWVAKLKAKRN
jgi:secreted trypsin-like serine protease